MYPFTKFQSFCRTSDYESKFPQKSMTDKRTSVLGTKFAQKTL